MHINNIYISKFSQYFIAILTHLEHNLAKRPKCQIAHLFSYKFSSICFSMELSKQARDAFVIIWLEIQIVMKCLEQSNFRKSENTVLMAPSSSVIKNPYKNNVLMDDVKTNKHFSHYKGNCQIRKTKGNCQIRKTKGNWQIQKTKGNHVIFCIVSADFVYLISLSIPSSVYVIVIHSRRSNKFPSVMSFEHFWNVEETEN